MQKSVFFVSLAWQVKMASRARTTRRESRVSQSVAHAIVQSNLVLKGKTMQTIDLIPFVPYAILAATMLVGAAVAKLQPLLVPVRTERE